jgi:hypothetical protein
MSRKRFLAWYAPWRVEILERLTALEGGLLRVEVVEEHEPPLRRRRVHLQGKNHFISL